ncbi:MAG: cysteine--tRNA ligase, partial [Candidatus Heimdallarchaeota archaeon]|nr:cysteine--tRNA ligase [Candidatus Heimdallarchaeota archaeon]
QKMGRSLGNFITLDELFAGTHKLLEQAYSPMAIRFFMLQAHYRSTLDFSKHALQAAEKGMERLFEAAENLQELSSGSNSSFNIEKIIKSVYEAISDDLNSPIAIAKLFDAVRYINLIKEGKESLSEADMSLFKEFFPYFIGEILGLKKEKATSNNLTAELIESILEIRQEAKNNKDFHTSDLIRDKLIQAGVEIKDGKDGAEWKFRST